MKTIKMMSKSIFLLMYLCLIWGNINAGSSVAVVSGDIIPDEEVFVYTSAITGANTVQVIFTRSGPDAGRYNVLVTYTVRFNTGHPSEKVDTFQTYVFGGSTYEVDYVAGPIPTGDAEVIDVQLDYEL